MIMIFSSFHSPQVTCLSQIYALGGTDNQQTIHYSCEGLDSETVQWAYAKSMQVGILLRRCAKFLIRDYTNMLNMIIPLWYDTAGMIMNVLAPQE